MTKKQNEVLQFLLVFNTATVKQLIQLTNCTVQDINYLLSNKLIEKDKKTNFIYHRIRGFDVKVMVALDIICKYKKDIQKYSKGRFPSIINFTVDDTTYDIIVARTIEQESILQKLDEKSFADKVILVIENKEMYNVADINTNRECLICTYPLQIIAKVN